MFKKTVAAYVVAMMFGLGNAMPIVSTQTHELNMTSFCAMAGTWAGPLCDKFNLTALPTLSTEAVKPNNTRHGLVDYNLPGLPILPPDVLENLDKTGLLPAGLLEKLNNTRHGDVGSESAALPGLPLFLPPGRRVKGRMVKDDNA